MKNTLKLEKKYCKISKNALKSSACQKIQNKSCIKIISIAKTHFPLTKLYIKTPEKK